MSERERERDDETTADESVDQVKDEGTAPATRRTDAEVRVAERDKPSIDEALARLERLEKQLAASNKNAAAARRRAEELEEKERKLEEAKLGEDERVKRQLKEESSKRADAEARAAEAAAKLRQHEIDRAVEREAAKSYSDRPEFLEPDIVPRLIDPSGIDVDEDGHILGVKEAVKKLAADKPSLLKPKAQGGTPPRGSSGGTRPTRQGSDDEIKQSLLAKHGHSYGSL